MLTNTVLTTKPFQAGQRGTIREFPSSFEFHEGKRARIGDIPSMMTTSQEGANSTTKNRTNDHATFPYAMIQSGELRAYTRRSYMHFLFSFTNYRDVPGNKQYSTGPQPRSLGDSILTHTGNTRKIPSRNLNLLPAERMILAAGGPAICLKLPVANCFLAESQSIAGGTRTITEMIKDFSMTGNCKTTDIEQEQNWDNGIGNISVIKTGHFETYAIWNRMEGSGDYMYLVEPPVGTPLYFVMQMVDLDVESAKTDSWVFKKNPGEYELTYHLDPTSNKPKVVTIRGVRYIWQLKPWFRGDHSRQDYPDLFDIRDCACVVEEDNSRCIIPGAYWYIGYQWETCIAPLKTPIWGVNYCTNVGHIERSNVSIIRCDLARCVPITAGSWLVGLKRIVLPNPFDGPEDEPDNSETQIPPGRLSKTSQKKPLTSQSNPGTTPKSRSGVVMKNGIAVPVNSTKSYGDRAGNLRDENRKAAFRAGVTPPSILTGYGTTKAVLSVKDYDRVLEKERKQMEFEQGLSGLELSRVREQEKKVAEELEMATRQIRVGNEYQ